MKLSNRLSSYDAIGIIGMSKNAGKTTVLNSLLEEYKTQSIAITSIGLDGEAYDTLTQRVKPRIILYEDMLVATAKDALKESTADIKILVETDIRTPLGVIIIGRVKRTGTVLVAGPSSNYALARIKDIFLELDAYKILIDGALFRKSFVTSQLVDAVIVVSGAAYSQDLNRLINDTSSVVNSLTIPHHPSLKLEDAKWALLSHDYKIIYESKESLSLHPQSLLKVINQTFKYLQVNGAINDALCAFCLEHRTLFKGKTLIVNDPVNILCSPKYITYLDTIGVHLVTRNTVNIPFIAINPFDTLGYAFDPTNMKKAFEQAFDYPIINVVTDKEETYE
ncbi:MAG: hypothetical protein UMR38_01755 [Candidatus Izemoplasma sp.]|nr:hypothetical protein [Candidatus Izemoplasma sp.]